MRKNEYIKSVWRYSGASSAFAIETSLTSTLIIMMIRKITSHLSQIVQNEENMTQQVFFSLRYFEENIILRNMMTSYNWESRVSEERSVIPVKLLKSRYLGFANYDMINQDFHSVPFLKIQMKQRKGQIERISSPKIYFRQMITTTVSRQNNTTFIAYNPDIVSAFNSAGCTSSLSNEKSLGWADAGVTRDG